MNKDITAILTEEIDDEIMSEMPLWFKILREKCQQIPTEPRR
jgi:hypothetical protein